LSGDLDASLVTGTLAVTTTAVPTSDIITGDHATSIDGLAIATAVNATALVDGRLLTLAGISDYTVTALSGDLDASLVTGTLAVTTTAVPTSDITIGDHATSINGLAIATAVNATALVDGRLLTLAGISDYTVTALSGDLDASLVTGTLAVTTTAVPTSDITIGDHATSINGLAIATAVNATALVDGRLLTLAGISDYTVTALSGDLDASAVTGTVDVTGLTDAQSITTGSGNDTITGGLGADTIHAGAGNDIINGDESDVLLDGGTGTNTLNIGTNFNASSDGQIINVETIAFTAAGLTVDISNQSEDFTVNAYATGTVAQSITTGSGNDTITSGLGADTIHAGAGNDIINGDDSDVLLDGGASIDTLNIGTNFNATSDGQIINVETIAFTATGLTVDLSAQTEGFIVEAYTTGISTLVTGSGVYTVNGVSGATVVIDATAINDDVILTLSGAADFTVNNLSGDLVASAVTGTLTVTTAAVVSTDIATGTAITSIGGLATAANVDASALLDNTLLTLADATNYTVTDLKGNLDASALTGILIVTTATVATSDIITGDNATSISGSATATAVNAIQLADDVTLTLTGISDYTVTNLVGDLSAGGVSGNVTVTALGGSQAIQTGSGNDTITGGAGVDNMDGGAGDDIFIIANAADFASGEIIVGGTGSDAIYFTSTTISETLTLSANVTVESARIADSSGVATGTTALNIDATNVIGAINLYGNDGANELIGNNSANVINGNGGADTITGGAGADNMDGGAGDDIFIIANAADFAIGEVIVGGDGSDAIYFTSTIASETLTLSADVNVESARIANSSGIATGTTTLNIDATLVSVAINLYGNDGNNTLTGNAADNILNGGAGVDTISGGAGNDTITGGADNDSLLGGDGNDTFVYTSLVDLSLDSLINGGAGTDSLNLNITGSLVISDNIFTNITNMERLIFDTTDSIQLTLDTKADITFGNGITIVATDAFYLDLRGGNSNISVNVTGTANDDILTTGAGNDYLSGGLGIDTITAGFGADTVNGGAEDDVIYLGQDTNSDTLVIGSVASSGIDSVSQLNPSYDYIQFAAVSAYNYAGAQTGANLDAVLVTLAASNLSGTAVGFTYNNLKYVFINEVNNIYDANDDSVVKLTGTVDLTLITDANFIA
jgi:Ca2+-binding RTX toxin-like protein